jgi:hypothetical protein
MRCVSNLVEDRDVSKWSLAAAIEKITEAAVLLVNEIVVNK